MSAPQATSKKALPQEATRHVLVHEEGKNIDDGSLLASEKMTENVSGSTNCEAATPTQGGNVIKAPAPQRKGFAIALTTLGLMTAVLLVALDTNILAIVIPKITTEFSSLDDVAWYGSAYNVTKMALQPTFGRLYYCVRLKMIFWFAIALFLIGSIICAVASSSPILIFGRAIQGCGCAGITSGILSIMAFIVSKEKMPIFIAISSSTYAVAGALGPTIGGVLSESSLTWRFCFWINLPIGALATLIIALGFTEPDRESTKGTILEKLNSLDAISSCILIGATTCLILALQWGGTTLPWSNSQVWGCLLGFALLLTAFIALQIRRKDRALIPMRILTQRTIAATCAVITCQMITVTGITYYLPVFFQASKGLSSTTAGIYLLAFALPSPVFSFASGWLVTVTGQYIPWLLAGGVIITVATGLLTTLTVGGNEIGRIIGFEFLASAGFGLAVQQPLVAIRNVLAAEDMPMGNALFVFFQAFGATVGLGIAQVIFLGTLKNQLDTRLSDKEVADIIALGAAGQDKISPDVAPFVADSYGKSVQAALYLSVATGGLSFLFAFLVEWKRVTPEPKVSKEQPVEKPVDNSGT